MRAFHPALPRSAPLCPALPRPHLLSADAVLQLCRALAPSSRLTPPCPTLPYPALPRTALPCPALTYCLPMLCSSCAGPWLGAPASPHPALPRPAPLYPALPCPALTYCLPMLCSSCAGPWLGAPTSRWLE